MELIKNIDIAKVVADITLAVKNGNVNALDAYITLKKLEEVVKLAKANIDEDALLEANKYSGKVFNISNAEITKKSAPGQYDFSNIPEIVIKEEELKDLKAKHKAALKLDVIDLDTGELIVAPLYKGGKEIISIKLNK
jgi:hypothetical protein